MNNDLDERALGGNFIISNKRRLFLPFCIAIIAGWMDACRCSLLIHSISRVFQLKRVERTRPVFEKLEHILNGRTIAWNCNALY